MPPRLLKVEVAEPIDISSLGGLSINVREESLDSASVTAMAANSWTYTTVSD
jgi:hypothetical protein